jgi:pimeloyl-ACP methyl ester carboxylesterase
MKLHSWTHHTSAGFTLRGHHSLPSGRPVIHFLHGNGLSSLTYSPLLKRLEEHFDLFLSDVQGHGDSDHGGRFRGWNHAAEMAAEAWRAHAPQFGQVPVHAAGHSFGSVLTCLMLAHHPHTFARGVLLDPVLFSPAMIGMMALSDLVGLASRNKLAAGARNRRHHWPDRLSAHANLHGRGVFRGWREDCFQAYIDHALRDVPGGGVELKCRPTREAEIFASYPRRLWSSLARIRQPVLALRGRTTFAFAARSITRWAAGQANVGCQEIPGGHCFMQEDPDTCADAMIPFLLAPGR